MEHTLNSLKIKKKSIKFKENSNNIQINLANNGSIDNNFIKKSRKTITNKSKFKDSLNINLLSPIMSQKINNRQNSIDSWDSDKLSFYSNKVDGKLQNFAQNFKIKSNLAYKKFIVNQPKVINKFFIY